MTLARFHLQDSHSSIHTLNHSPNVLARFFLYLLIDVIITYNPIKLLEYSLTYHIYLLLVIPGKPSVVFFLSNILLVVPGLSF